MANECDPRAYSSREQSPDDLGHVIAGEQSEHLRMPVMNLQFQLRKQMGWCLSTGCIGVGHVALVASAV